MLQGGIGPQLFGIDETNHDKFSFLSSSSSVRADVKESRVVLSRNENDNRGGRAEGIATSYPSRRGAPDATLSFEMLEKGFKHDKDSNLHKQVTRTVVHRDRRPEVLLLSSSSHQAVHVLRMPMPPLDPAHNHGAIKTKQTKQQTRQPVVHQNHFLFLCA